PSAASTCGRILSTGIAPRAHDEILAAAGGGRLAPADATAPLHRRRPSAARGRARQLADDGRLRGRRRRSAGAAAVVAARRHERAADAPHPVAAGPLSAPFAGVLYRP